MNTDKMMWAVLLHLGSNMWRKRGQISANYKDEDDDFVFRDKLHTDKEVWAKVTDFLPSCGINTIVIDIGDGVVLNSHPEIAVEGAWTIDELRTELDRLRSIGLEPIPKCNFSCGHSAWLKDYAYMVGTDTYYKVCDDIVNEIIDIFDKPRFFHLGLEEEDANAQKNQPIITVRSPEIKLRDALCLFDVCKAKGVRPWIWCDPETVEGFGGKQVFCDNIPKDTLISNYFYGIIRDNPETLRTNPRVKQYFDLDEWGYEQVPTSSTWNWHLNSKDTMRICSKYVSPESIKGYMSASWMLTTKNKYYALLNDAYTFGVAKEKYYPDK